MRMQKISNNNADISRYWRLVYPIVKRTNNNEIPGVLHFVQDDMFFGGNRNP